MNEKNLSILNDCKELFFMIDNFIKNYPEYKYNLNNHILRTVISIGSNIAEGNSLSDKMAIKHFIIAKGSCTELIFQISLYKDDTTQIIDKIDKIKAVCHKLIVYRRSLIGNR